MIRWSQNENGPSGSGSVKSERQRLSTYAGRESDRRIVVKKPTNNMQVKQPDHSGVGGAKASNDKEWRNMPDSTVTQSAEAESSGLLRLHSA